MDSLALTKLEPFLLIAKGSKGAGTAKCVEQATSAPGVYIFSELLSLPSVRQLDDNPDTKPYWNLVQLFAFGTWSDHQANPTSYPALSDTQAVKLKHLTIVSLSKSNRTLPYPLLLSSLSLTSVREIEDLLIEGIFHGCIKGKMDQQKACFLVDECIGRDVNPQKGVESLRDELKLWASTQLSLIDGLAATISQAQLESNNHQSQLLDYQIARDKAVGIAKESSRKNDEETSWTADSADGARKGNLKKASSTQSALSQKHQRKRNRA